MNNALKLVFVVIVLVVLAAAGYYFSFGQDFEKPTGNNDQQNTTAFFETGTLTRNSAYVSEPWYIEYQQNGQMVKERLGFEGDAICSRNQENIGCGDFGFRPNDKIQVHGERKSDYIAVSQLDVVESAPEPVSTDTFKETKEYGFYGTLTLAGYVDVQRRVCNPGDMCGETVDYVSFVFANTSNEAIKKFTGSMQGNSFVAGDRVGIGCQRKSENKIQYENDADIGWKSGEISGSDYTRLIGSNKDNPVQLKMTREIYTSGRGAPDCYSHFRNFDVL